MDARNENGMQTIFEGGAEWETSLAQIDLDEVHRKFSELFDQAARANTLAGFDLDDVLVERHVVCTMDGVEPIKVSADHLSDRDRFVAHVLSTVNAADYGGPCPPYPNDYGGPCPPYADDYGGQCPPYVTEQVTIVELRVTVIREPQP